MDIMLIWAVVLLVAAMVLLFLELFVPSVGIIGTMAAICLVSSLVMFFRFDTVTGIVASGIVALALPFILLGATRLWPHSPLAKYFTLHTQQERLTNPEIPGGGDADGLLGAEGRAITDLRPVGTCVINGKRIECLAASGVVPAASRIKVVSVDGMNVKVKAIEA